MSIPRTYYLAIVSAGILAAYLLGVFMFYPTYYGLPEFFSKISPVFFLPQMFGIFILIPLAVGQFLLAFVKRGKSGVNVVHYFYSGVVILACQLLYWVFTSNGFIITN